MADFDPDRLLTEPAPSIASMTVRPRKLSREDTTNLVRKYNPDITAAAVRGEVDNIMRESDGNAANDTGDHDTSGGLYQHHNERLTGLKKFAASERADWRDPDIQVRYSRLEKERDYPGLLKLQQNVSDPAKAEDAFKRIFERPASVLWQTNPDGQPVLGNDRFKFSDYAMGEHNGRPGTSIAYMPPGDYLDLSPELNGKPFANPSGRALRKSFDRGEPIEAIPTLDMKVEGNTGTVTDQDGRHRALLAQEQGIDAIPVAIRQQGVGTPTEIQGMSGKLLPNDFVKPADVSRVPHQEQPSAPKEPISLLGRIGQAIISSAEAVEPDAWAEFRAPEAGAAPAPAQDEWGAFRGSTPASAPAGDPDNMVVSGIKGAAKGLGDTVLAGQELLGKGMQGVGVPGGDWLVKDAREGMAKLKREIAPDQAAHPNFTGTGEFLGNIAIPGGVATRTGINALRAGALSGAISGVLTPDGSDEHFWRDKVLGAGVGAGVGAAVGKGVNAISGLVAPTLRATVGKLMSEGVELTPGQMTGGHLKRAEDALSSVPILGSVIRAAQKRSFETFNRAAINRSLDDIGVKLPKGLDSGHDAIGFAQDEFSKAYGQVIPRMSGTLDNPMRQDLLNVLGKAQAQNLPQEYQEQLLHIIKTEVVGNLGAGGRMTGEAAQKIGTQLDALIKPMRISPNPYVQHMGRLLREVDQSLDDMMSRQNPILQATKDRIDAGYAKFKSVQQAAAAVGTHPDGTFTPAQLNRAIKARDRSKDKAAFARGDAMMQDLAIAARDVLPQVVRDSGTPERGAYMAMAGGAVPIEPHTAAALAGMAVPYTAPVSRALNATINRLTQGPGIARNALAEILRRGAPLAGSAAGSEAASRFGGQ